MTSPGIYRGKLSFEQGFTRIPNQWLRDRSLGFRAKGLLAYLLSHEVGYTITFGQIERETGDGRHAIRTAVDELVKYGYLKTKRTSNERGWNAGLEWILCEPNPKSENPTLENPTLENQTAIEEHLNREEQEKRTNAQGELERQFNLWWEFYPRKTAKLAARRAYEKAVAMVGFKILFDGVERFAHDPNKPAAQFLPHPATWLNEGRWDDEPYPERVMTAEEKQAHEQAQVELRRAKERAASERLKAEMAEAEARAKADPPKRCEHDRIAVMCEKCRKS